MMLYKTFVDIYIGVLQEIVLCTWLKRFFSIQSRTSWYTQVLRYVLFCEGVIFGSHALTLVGKKLTPYIGVTL